jgi:hypothetical protein
VILFCLAEAKKVAIFYVIMIVLVKKAKILIVVYKPEENNVPYKELL